MKVVGKMAVLGSASFSQLADEIVAEFCAAIDWDLEGVRLVRFSLAALALSDLVFAGQDVRYKGGWALHLTGIVSW